MTPEQIDAYAQLAERVKERFGDNWQIVFDPDCDDDASVRTEESTSFLFTEVFTTSQTGGDDPLEVAGFLASAIAYVPALVAEVKRLTARVDELWEDSDFLDALRTAGVDNWEGYDYAQEIRRERQGEPS